MWPWIFMVRSSTVFPLGVWTDIIFDALASAVIGASNAPAVSKQSENLAFFPPGGSPRSTRMK
jgi:hypothetical protein